MSNKVLLITRSYWTRLFRSGGNGSKWKKLRWKCFTSIRLLLIGLHWRRKESADLGFIWSWKWPRYVRNTHGANILSIWQNVKLLVGMLAVQGLESISLTYQWRKVNVSKWISTCCLNFNTLVWNWAFNNFHTSWPRIQSLRLIVRVEILSQHLLSIFGF